MGYHEIIPNLYVGDYEAAFNENVLKRMDVVINCAKELPFHPYAVKNTIRYHVPSLDNLEEKEIKKMSVFLQQLYPEINKHHSQGKSIFIHCYAGRQRSAIVCCYYLMRKFNWPFEKAKREMQKKRDVVFQPNCNFRHSLCLIEQNRNLPK